MLVLVGQSIRSSTPLQSSSARFIDTSCSQHPSFDLIILSNSNPESALEFPVVSLYRFHSTSMAGLQPLCVVEIEKSCSTDWSRSPRSIALLLFEYLFCWPRLSPSTRKVSFTFYFLSLFLSFFFFFFFAISSHGKVTFKSNCETREALNFRSG